MPTRKPRKSKNKRRGPRRNSTPRAPGTEVRSSGSVRHNASASTWALPGTLGRKFEDLVALQARLRAPGGCPWDAEQTHQSLRSFLLEETYEVLDAVDSGDPQRLADELGDLLLQIVFHAEMAREAGRFDVGAVIDRIHAKMVRRHPHVFGDAKAADSAAVLKSWEQLKSAERDAKPAGSGRTPRASILDGVPATLPALLEAYQLTRRAANVGFDWDGVDGLFEKLREETAEVRHALAARDTSNAAKVEEEMGDLLFVAVNLARFLGLDPELALRKANRKFAARFQDMEQEMAQRGQRLEDAQREEMEELWESSKRKAAGGAR